MSRLVVTDEAEHQLGGAVPSPAAAFLIAMLTLPVLFWLVMLKRTTVSTAPEEWLMGDVLPAIHTWIQVNLPPVEALIVAISGLGSGWFVALAFAILGLLALSRGRRDLALLLALGTLAFPMEWALKYFVSPEAVTIQQLVSAIFDVGGIGLDDIADFPAGHALRATVLYGLIAFCIARLSHDVRQGYTAYVVAADRRRRHQRDAHLPRRAFPDRRPRRMDGRRLAARHPGGDPRPPRRRGGAGRPGAVAPGQAAPRCRAADAIDLGTRGDRATAAPSSAAEEG